MIKWYDSSGNYVGYAAPVNGLIHYFSSDNAGVITDLGVTKPVSFDTTCCAPADTTVKVRTAGRLFNTGFTNFNFGANQLSLFTASYTNTATVPVLFSLDFITDQIMVVPAGPQLNASFRSLTSSIPAIGYWASTTTQFHRADYDSNNTVARTIEKYDQANTHTFLLTAGQTVTFTGGYGVAANSIPTVAGNTVSFAGVYTVVEA